MSHWVTPDTIEKAEALRDLMAQPLKARFAARRLADIAGSDVLFDRIDEVCLASPYSDVRGIVSNWLEQIVFSWNSPLDVVSQDAARIVSDIAGSRHATDPALRALARFGEQDFRQVLSDVGLRHRNDIEWEIASDDGGYDLFAQSQDGDMYRFSKIDGGLTDIHEDNRGRCAKRFEPILEAAP